MWDVVKVIDVACLITAIKACNKISWEVHLKVRVWRSAWQDWARQAG